MSVQKNTSSFLKHSGLSFTTIINQVIDMITDNAALGLYVYLASKPSGWQINEKDLCRRFNRGVDHIRKQMKLLRSLGLIIKEAIKNEKGQITHWETTLVNFVDKSVKDGEKPEGEKTTCGKSTLLENTPHINKRSKNKRILTKKVELLDKFYPDEQNQKKADRIANQCNTNGSWLIQRFKEVTAKSGWQIDSLEELNSLFSRFLDLQQPSSATRVPLHS